MLLDANGRMVQTMRSWTVLQPGETASCVGCHEPKNSSPPKAARPTLATAAGVQKLTPVLDSPRAFSFLKDVQPILNARCVKCHAVNAAKAPDLSDAPVAVI